MTLYILGIVLSLELHLLVEVGRYLSEQNQFEPSLLTASHTVHRLSHLSQLPRWGYNVRFCKMHATTKSIENYTFVK
jgi:hypothetical protein